MFGYSNPQIRAGLVHSGCLTGETTCNTNCIRRVGGEEALQRLAERTQKTVSHSRTLQSVAGDPNVWLHTECALDAIENHSVCEHCAPILDGVKQTLRTRTHTQALGKFFLGVVLVAAAGQLATWAWRRIM